ncbi:MAG: hypothetical protein QOF33_2939, partial [Thermomicrobiales bacterium]|nr:hypothetical protein [Thermomicrobiales bacterium]
RLRLHPKGELSEERLDGQGVTEANA